MIDYHRNQEESDDVDKKTFAKETEAISSEEVRHRGKDRELQSAIKILQNISNNCKVIHVRRGKATCSDSQCWEREGKGRGQIILCIF